MADITIPQLNAATSVSGTDVMVISQAGVTKKVEVDKLTEKVLSSSVDILHMNPTTLQTLANVGELAFNPDTQTLEVKCSADVTLSIGQENYIRGKNAESDTILNGAVVYVSGGQGANSLIKRAGNADGTAERVIGVATQDIGANNIGFITTSGVVNKLDTSAYEEGDLLWLGTNGAMTNVKPDTSVDKIGIGVVLRSHATEGSLLVAVKDDWRDKLAEVRSDLNEMEINKLDKSSLSSLLDLDSENNAATSRAIKLLNDKVEQVKDGGLENGSIELPKLSPTLAAYIGSGGEVTNQADDDDLENTIINGVPVIREKTTKTYTPETYSGMGRVILRKNMVNGVNVLTQEMINQANTIYEIRYDFTLDEDITIPANCILEFDGGSVSGANVYLKDITKGGNYYGNNLNYKTRIIINKGCTLNNFKLNGYIWISTTEKVILNNCEIYQDSQTITDFLINIDAANANLELKNSKIYCNSSVKYGVYCSKQITSLLVHDCEFYGMREIAINCSNRILSCLIEGNHIHDIGTADTLLSNAIGVRINTNLDDNNPDYSLYDDMSIVVRNNVIEHIISQYTVLDDTCEGHGIIVYGNNVVIANNFIKDLLSGLDNEHLNIYCGSEHEGIYVKGDNCTIVNNTLINACGNYGSEGAIAVKWNGLGGTICGNKIIQSFGNAIWTQCRNVRISNNYICYIQDENTQSLQVGRYYCIYNTATLASLIPIHTNRKYTTIIENNNIELRDVLNYAGYVFSFDGGTDDLQINNNKIECTGYIQILRNVDNGIISGEKAKVINFSNNIIRKPFAVNTGSGVAQQEFWINTEDGNGTTPAVINISNNRIMFYKNIPSGGGDSGPVITHYQVTGKQVFRINGNKFEAPDKTTVRFNTDFMKIDDSILEVEFYDNVFNLNLYAIFVSSATGKFANLYIRDNQFGSVARVLRFSKLDEQGTNISKINNFIFIGNIYDRSSSSTMELIGIPSEYSSAKHGRILYDMIICNNVYKACNISSHSDYYAAVGGDRISVNNYPTNLNF